MRLRGRGDDALRSLRLWHKEREEELVGALLYRPELFRAVRGVVRAEDFHGYRAGRVFAAMEAVDGRGRTPTVDAVAEELPGVCTDVTLGDVVALHGGRWLLRPEQALEYAREVRGAAMRRRLLAALDEARRALAEAPDVEEVRSQLYAALDAADARDVPVERDTYEALMVALSGELDSEAGRPLSTGFAGLDRVCGGLGRGTLVLVGARTSTGKTAFATAMAVARAQAGARVSFLSVEMDRLSIAMRYLGAVAGVSMRALQQRALNDDEIAAFVDAAGLALPLCTDDGARTLAQVRVRAQQHKRLLGGLDLLLVDYLQLLQVRMRSGERRYEALGRVSRGLKRLAQDLAVPVVALCQLSRATDDRATEPPRLSDLRESGDLEQDADQVWLLWRPPRARDTWAGRAVQIIVAKNRQGPTGRVDLRFQPERMRFVEMEDDE